MNWFLFMLMVALTVAGLWFIKSAGEYADNADLFVKQEKYAAVSLAVYLLLTLTNYEWWLKLAPLFFTAALATLLALLLLKGTPLALTINGATSWLKVGGVILQPAEPAKIAFILGLSWFLLVLGEHRGKFWLFALTGLLALLPAVLILKQPDLGTALVFFPITLVIMWAANLPKRYLLLLAAAVGAGVLFARFVIYQAWWDGTAGDLWPATKRTAYVVAGATAKLPAAQQAKLTPLTARKKSAPPATPADTVGAVNKKAGVLVKPYQLGRIRTFFDPDLDPLGAGWTIRQSLNTIGSGGFSGKGFVSEYGFLPKNIAYNDFIFAVIGEEVGFIGSALFILGQGALIFGVMHVAARAKDSGGVLICLGFAALLFTHFFQNVAMTIGLTPITGIPLPFISYGGSFLLTCMAGMGLVQSVWIHRKNFYNHQP
ncbi:MAG: FtsW/RodA/SpoVE family cell cycle protein [Verrucomicrobiales bacterium]|nr:FtsW/RodA/SpoVE family cell cycle protein [Verrucomicrobiales bacterium]